MPEASSLAMTRVQSRAIVFDTETTGLSPRQGDRIVEIGAVELIDGRPSGREFHSYINPRRDVPWRAVQIHSLSAAFLADKPAFEDLVEDWLAFVGDSATPLWAHNASFDQGFLHAELEWAGHPTCGPVNCSLRLARSVLSPGKCDLETLVARLGTTFTGRGAHSALSDARALALVLCDLLWPAQAAMAATAKPASATRYAPALGASHPPGGHGLDELLPPGFVALSPSADARIRRYDDVDVSDHLSAKGTRWSPEEDARLVRGFLHESRDILELVRNHGRSPAALLLRLDRLGIIKVGELFYSVW